MIKKLLSRLRGTAKQDRIRHKFPEITDDEVAIISRYRELTMTGLERQWALIGALRYLNRGGIAGDVVECGVWRGGNMMMARHLGRQSGVERDYYLFDTFTGMSEPTKEDVSHHGEAASVTFEQKQRPDHVDWCYASLEDVRANFSAAGLLDERVKFIKGKVEDTLRVEANVPKQIALLRLDTDFYESTRIELEVLYPRLVKGGVLIIDDYGYWKGAQQAVDEYFRDRNVLLMRIDRDARITIKQQ